MKYACLYIYEDGFVFFLIEVLILGLECSINNYLIQGKKQSLSLLVQTQLHTLAVRPFAAEGCIVLLLVLAVTLI